MRETSVATVLAVDVGARPGAEEHSGPQTPQTLGPAGSGPLPPAAEEAALPAPGL